MSSWHQISCGSQGVPLKQGEKIIKQFENTSLYVPKLKLEKIGTLTYTNLRLVFCIFRSPAAYELDVGSITKFVPSEHKGYPEIACCECSSGSEEFSFQMDMSMASELSAEISLIALTSSQPMQKKIVNKKKIISTNAKEAVGISAIKDAVNSDISMQNEKLESGLQDINTLKESANELMKIATQLRSKNDKDSQSDLGTVLLALGVSDPVTRDTAGKSFAKELARQFATFMTAVLAKTGGVLSVAEAYCLYNRSLGTNYVSPNDLADAIKQLQHREYGVKIETIEGVTVVILSDKQYKSILNDILSKFGENEYTTPLLMSKKTQLPISITRNYLLRAEADGVLCRDDSMAGLRFYKNIFNSFSLIE